LWLNSAKTLNCTMSAVSAPMRKYLVEAENDSVVNTLHKEKRGEC